MKYILFALFFAALTGAQTPSVSIQPHHSDAAVLNGGGRAGIAILGYATGPGPLDLREITGTGKSAQLGAVVSLPRGTKRVIVPPRQHFVLLESSGSDALAVWRPNRSETETALTGAFAHPDSVTFSPRGDTALLYSKSANRLQIVTGLPAEPNVSQHTGIAGLGDLTSFAVSDDGSTLVALTADGSAFISKTSNAKWLRFPAAYNATSVLFVPNTRTLAISDSGQKTIALVSNPGDDTQTSQIAAHGIAADRLAFTREGYVLVAASTAEKKVWSIDLRTQSIAPVWAASIDSLLPLRDGHTFLVSPATVSLLNVPVESDRSAPAFVPVVH